MGNATSSWRNDAPKNYYFFLLRLLGKPTSIGGQQVRWEKNRYAEATLFGNKIIFNRVLLFDNVISVADPAGSTTPRQHFLLLHIDLPLNGTQLSNITTITSSFSYNAEQKLFGISCDCIDTGVAALRVITDFLSAKISLAAAPAAYLAALAAVYNKIPALVSDNDADLISLTKSNYLALMTNLGVTVTGNEHFAGGAPWYADDVPYYTSDPGHVELGLAEDEQYYRNSVGEQPYYEIEDAHIKATVAAAQARNREGRRAGTAPNDVPLAPTRLVGTPSDNTVEKAVTALTANSGQVAAMEHFVKSRTVRGPSRR